MGRVRDGLSPGGEVGRGECRLQSQPGWVAAPQLCSGLYDFDMHVTSACFGDLISPCLLWVRQAARGAREPEHPAVCPRLLKGFVHIGPFNCLRGVGL